jgi:hypothetical protein
MSLPRQPQGRKRQLTADSANGASQSAARFLDLVFAASQGVHELRIFPKGGRKRTVAGWFDSAERARLALRNTRYPGNAQIYITLNPCKPALHARIANRLDDADKTTTDGDISRRLWLYVDLDPERPSGISSTEDEHHEALEQARRIRALVRERGWPEPVLADSGNGAALLYRIDLPNDASAKELVKAALEGIAHLAEGHRDGESYQLPGALPVLVDLKVFNAGRIVRVFGTLNCKGDSTADRPHRESKLLEVPEQLVVVSQELLSSMAALLPSPPDRPHTRPAAPHSRHPWAWDATRVEEFIQAHHLEVHQHKQGPGRQIWVLKVCPFDAAHTDRSACITLEDDGQLGFKCQHNGCSGKGWRDLRAKLDPALRPAETTPREPLRSPKPSLLLTGRDPAEIREECWKLLVQCDPPEAFLRDGRAVHLLYGEDGYTIACMTPARFCSAVEACATPVRGSKIGPIPADLPKTHGERAIARPWDELPPLQRIARAPVYTETGLLNRSGYHREHALFMSLPEPLERLRIAERPTAEQVAQAKDWLLSELLSDFPFVADSDRTHYVAALLLPFVRPLINGPTPLHLIESPTPGSGKSKLATVCGLIATGEAPAPSALSGADDEQRKQLTSLIASGSPILLLDNINAKLAGGALAAALTAWPYWRDRILGRNDAVQTVPNNALWLATGNNVLFSDEVARRAIRIRIDPRTERPEERTGFKHDPLEPWVLKSRPHLVQALLTLVAHWLAIGRSLWVGPPMGSFESWTRLLGGILEAAQVPGFMADRTEFLASADAEGQEWREFVLRWYAAYEGQWCRVATLRDLLLGFVVRSDTETGEEHRLKVGEELLPAVLGEGTDRSQVTRLGMALQRKRGRIFAGYAIESSTNTHKNIGQYRLVDVNSVAK